MYAGAYFGSIGYGQMLTFAEALNNIIHKTVPEPIGSNDNSANLSAYGLMALSTIDAGPSTITMSNETDSGILNLE